MSISTIGGHLEKLPGLLHVPLLREAVPGNSECEPPALDWGEQGSDPANNYALMWFSNLAQETLFKAKSSAPDDFIYLEMSSADVHRTSPRRNDYFNEEHGLVTCIPGLVTLEWYYLHPTGTPTH